jgi:hypothetical protein
VTKRAQRETAHKNQSDLNNNFFAKYSLFIYYTQNKGGKCSSRARFIIIYREKNLKEIRNLNLKITKIWREATDGCPQKKYFFEGVKPKALNSEQPLSEKNLVDFFLQALQRVF